MPNRPVVVVTGAGSGMGEATARRLARAGWSVVAVDVAGERLAWAEGEANVIGHTSDVSSEEGNANFVSAALDRFGRLDAAVFNAAVIASGPIDRLPLEDLDWLYRVNLKGVVLGFRSVIPVLRDCGGGAITATASIGGMCGEERNWAYGTTKAGVINLVQSVALEVGRDNIRVNAVCPGPVQHTGMSAHVEQHAPDVYRTMQNMTALKRWGEPDEIAAVHEFLISPAASFVTGAVIPVDGGLMAGHSWVS